MDIYVCQKLSEQRKVHEDITTVKRCSFFASHGRLGYIHSEP